MSDFNRDVTAANYGTTAGQAVAVDEGLRAYMLRVYNYMVIGLAITGFAALGIYMLSVTGDMAAAAKVMRNGAEIPARIAANTYLTFDFLGNGFPGIVGYLLMMVVLLIRPYGLMGTPEIRRV